MNTRKASSSCWTGAGDRDRRGWRQRRTYFVVCYTGDFSGISCLSPFSAVAVLTLSLRIPGLSREATVESGKSFHSVKTSSG